MGEIVQIRGLSHFQKQPPVNLEFQDLAYTIPQWRKEPKVILRNISGQFRSGQLNAVMGPSGSGKTTLLNLLAGLKTSNTSGSIMMNGQPIRLKDFYKYSRYIMQDDLLQPFLTIEESMIYAADFKLDIKFSKEHKLTLITEILETLGLMSAKDTFSNKLSGGERKRLSIALELINNPPILFLDEPTSGLDDVSSSHCISLLKALAEGGRTIICAIHTPSAKNFENFDNVYVLSEGFCVYQGYGGNLIRFCSTLDLPCPTHYNPADFIIEIASGEYGLEYTKKSSEIMENGRNSYYCEGSGRQLESLELDGLETFQQKSSIFHQFKILTRRYFLQTLRNTHSVAFRTVIHILVGIVIGLAYSTAVNDASKSTANFAYSFLCLIICMYITILPVFLSFPKEVLLIEREHFNKWYGLTAYYLATGAVTLPLQAVLTPLSIGLAYIISNQPMEVNRFIPFLLVCIMLSATSESLALLVSSKFGIVHSMFLGSALANPILLLAVHGAQGYPIPVLIYWAMRLDYMRYGMELLTIFLYGFDRPRLLCPERHLMCILREPKKIIKFAGIGNVEVWFNLIMIVMWFFIFRVASFFIVRYRLRTDKKTIPILSVFS